MKVLFDYQIFTSQEYGGVSRYYMELKNELEKINGIQIDIKPLFPRNRYFQKKYHRKIYISKNKNWILFTEILNKMYNFLLCLINRYDVVHITWNARYLNRLCKSKLIVTVHDMIHELYMEDAVIEIRNKKRAIEDSAIIVADSYSTKNDILRLYPYIDEKKIKVVYLGTNHLPAAQKPSSVLLPAKYILYVGRREGYKNGMFYIKSIPRLLQMEPDLHFVFVGGERWNSSEEKLVDQYRDRIVQLQVSDAELAYIYQNAAAFVYPSLYEGFGLPVLEAFDNKCPVICSDTSSLPEVGGKAALYFDPLDMEDMIKQVMKVLDSEELQSEMIKKGQERVKTFTWEKSAQEICDIYRSLKESAYERT